MESTCDDDEIRDNIWRDVLESFVTSRETMLLLAIGLTNLRRDKSVDDDIDTLDELRDAILDLGDAVVDVQKMLSQIGDNRVDVLHSLPVRYTEDEMSVSE